jgi:hypothetical protein
LRFLGFDMGKRGPKPGAPRAGGRKPGTPNKVTADVKDAIKAAFEEAGGTAYLLSIAKEDPRTFCALLGKLVPTATTVGGDPDGEAIKQVIHIITGVPRASDE